MIEDIYAFFQKPKNPKDFDSIRIKLASPERIREWSYGEVEKPETINYRTFKPEHDGLFCAKIFGPVKDWECLCGKYKRMKHRGVICDKCGVEVIQSKVRRERMGHIELVAPIAHIWFLRSRPSIIGTLLDMTIREIEQVIYFEEYIVMDPGDTPLKEKEFLSEDEYKKKLSEFGSRFKAGMGAEAIRELLKKVDLEKLLKELKEQIKLTSSKTTKDNLARRLRLVDAFMKSGNRPEWMILDIIPVMPPDLRPLVPLGGSRFATSDLNDLYRRVINRNNRLKRLIEIGEELKRQGKPGTPSVIIKNEKRMLQEAVDALFDNSKKAKVLKAGGKRALKSLSDMIKGKEGRFRQNLLGKRVDYSGRSVIVPDPTLKLHQCGLPKKMALELFKPFVFNKLEEKDYATTIKEAKRLIEKETTNVWECLEEVMQEHQILLNRQPTLHKMGIQAFDPVLVDGLAIRLHPLVCKAFNADFDGDEMTVHVPLSVEAQIEARMLMSSVNNIFSPANGEPAIMPTQDIVFGIYYLTKDNSNAEQNSMMFADVDEARAAYDNEIIKEHTKIKVRIDGEIVETTTGRIIFKEILPCGFPFSLMNKTIKGNEIRDIIKYIYKEFGKQDTVDFLNRLMDLGFDYATKSGLSICSDDIIVPLWKEAIIEDARKKAWEYYKPSNNEDENENVSAMIDRKALLNKFWQKKVELINAEVQKEYDKTENHANSIRMMFDSQARGSFDLLKYLAGMRQTAQGQATPVLSSLKEGLPPMEYFITAYNGRKGLEDTAIKTANAGWLMRRLVDVAQDIVVAEDDCGSRDGIALSALSTNDVILLPFENRIIDRFSAETVRHPVTGDVLAEQNMEITEETAKRITEAGIERVKVRSVLTCHSNNGVCAKCYGRDLSRHEPVEIGDAVGIIAAQSIGEPTTQMTINSRHWFVENNITSGLPRIAELFEVRKPKMKTSLDLHEILKEHGLKDAQIALLNELQSVYGLQNISINDKHFEVIIRKMTAKVRIVENGDTKFLISETVARREFYEENARVQFEGGRQALGHHILEGITKASLLSDSWVSAASFQETTRVLTEAAISGAVDELEGLKENVIMGRLINAGSGLRIYRDTFIKSDLYDMQGNL